MMISKRISPLSCGRILSPISSNDEQIGLEVFP
jgi:hypothetical protein